MEDRELKKIVGKRLRHLREKRELTQQAVADAVFVHRKSISQYERGKQMPPAIVICRLAIFFNYPTDYLYGLITSKEMVDLYEAVRKQNEIVPQRVAESPDERPFNIVSKPEGKK